MCAGTSERLRRGDCPLYAAPTDGISGSVQCLEPEENHRLDPGGTAEGKRRIYQAGAPQRGGGNAAAGSSAGGFLRKISAGAERRAEAAGQYCPGTDHRDEVHPGGRTALRIGCDGAGADHCPSERTAGERKNLLSVRVPRSGCGQYAVRESSVSPRRKGVQSG